MPGHLHRQLRFSLPEVRKHITARRGSFSNERPGAFPTMTPVSRDPGWKISRGLGPGGGGALAGTCATTVQSRAKEGGLGPALFYALRGRSLFSITLRMCLG